MRELPDVKPGGYVSPDAFVQPGRVKLAAHLGVGMENDCLHPAADVHTHQVGADFVRDGHSSPDCAARTSMDVRHKAYPGAFSERLVAQGLDLKDGCLLHVVGENLSTVELSAYNLRSSHEYPPLLELFGNLSFPNRSINQRFPMLPILKEKQMR